MEKNKFIPESIRLRKVDIESANIYAKNYQGQEIVTIDQQLKFNDAYNLKDKSAKVSIGFNLSGLDEEQNVVITAEYNFNMYYSIDNMEELVDLEETKNTIDGSLVMSLASISYSTCRGMLYVRLQGTPMNGYFIPVIDPMEIVSCKYNNSENS